MAMSGGGKRPLVADRRYPANTPKSTSSTGAARSATPKSKPPKPPKSPRPARKQRGLLARIVFAILGGIWAVIWRVTAVGALIYGAIVLYFYNQLPELNALLDGRARGSVTLLDRNGQVFAWRGETFGGQIPVQNASKYLHDAVVATEDRRFYYHLGISPRGVISAIRINLAEGRGAFEGNGGSTITQQVAKLLCLGVDFDSEKWKSEAEYERDCRSGGMWRKIKEVPFSMAMEAKYSKEDILTIYFNRVYLGAGARGFEAAAQRYFGKSSANVNIAEAAMLAGLLKAPSTYAPTGNINRARDRANVVVGLLEEQGYISAVEAMDARENPAQLSKAAQQKSGGFFADWVMETTPDYLARDTTEDVVIETTLDQRMQAQSEEALRYVFETKLSADSSVNAAIVVMSADGAVRAMVGGRAAPTVGDFNRATSGLRQTGSSFKPFIYAAAMDLGYRPQDLIDDSPLTLYVPGSGNYSPKNYDGKFKGMITLADALAESRNIPAVKLQETVGRDVVRKVATEFGVAQNLADGPALALGASESTLIDMTGAYAGILNGGSSVTPYGLRALKLQGESEELFGQGGGMGERVISENAAYSVVSMMHRAIEQGTGRRAKLPDREAAGKSGTTNSSVDAWFVGFTADYVVGVWMGYDTPKPMKGVTGGGLPADIWREVMVRINKDLPVRPLPQPIMQDAQPVALQTSPDIGGVDRPIMAEEVPYFDAPDAPQYQGGPGNYYAPAGQNLGPVEEDPETEAILRDILGQ